MKRINLTENDIFNIVNKVIAEESKLTKTPEELIKRFLYGDNSIRPKIPGMKNRTFTIVEKRGLTKESFQFIVQDVEFIATSKGSSALIKGYVKGQTSDPSQQTILEYICNKKQKTPKVKSDSDGSFKNNVKQGIGNVKNKFQDVTQNTKEKVQNAKQGIQNVRQGIQNFKRGMTK
jgi:hypothetical protein